MVTPAEDAFEKARESFAEAEAFDNIANNIDTYTEIGRLGKADMQAIRDKHLAKASIQASLATYLKMEELQAQLRNLPRGRRLRGW